jgi:hypothetical protein
MTKTHSPQNLGQRRFGHGYITAANTVPGLDGISYAKWKKIDRGAYALDTVFNAVHRLGYIPQAWGMYVTILITKKGEDSNIPNWCPTSLSNTTAKLYSSILAILLG